MNQRHRKTCKRFDHQGDCHFLTFSCYKRLPLLNTDRSRLWMIEAIQLGQSKSMFDLWSYVIMPEHVHIVLLPTKGTKISSILTTIKQSISKKALLWLKENSPAYLNNLATRKATGRITHRFWQRGGGYDRNLRSVRDIHEKIRYTHDNPIRRELCKHPEEWVWSSANAWKTGIDEPLSIQRESVPILTNLDGDIRDSLFE